MENYKTKPEASHRSGRFGLSFWIKRKTVSVPDGMKETIGGWNIKESKYCLQYSVRVGSKWMNRSIWFKPSEVSDLINCLAYFHQNGKTDGQDGAEGGDTANVASDEENDKPGSEVTQKEGGEEAQLEPLFLSGNVIRAIERIKNMNKLIPGHGIWWSQEDVDLDIDSILTQYCMNSSQFNTEETHMLRKILLVMCERAKGLWAPNDLKAYADMALAS